MTDKEKYDFTVTQLLAAGKACDDFGMTPQEFFSYVSAIMTSIALRNGGMDAVRSVTGGMVEYGQALYDANAELFEAMGVANVEVTIH